MIDKTCILVPTFNPDYKLSQLVKNLEELFNLKDFPISPLILIINDGSYLPESKVIIDKLSKLGMVKVLSHKENMGKGSAIKTGLKYIKNNNVSFVITADSDGQHSAKDIIKVLKHSIETKKFVVGERSFSPETTPFKSRFGNRLTSFVLNLSIGMKMRDTQTGLRAFPTDFIRPLEEADGSRYEYEFNALIAVWEIGEVISIPIETIYFENNKKSSFRPIRDSLLIYFVFLRYFAFAITIGVADLILIYWAVLFFPVTYSFLVVRMVSAHIYFYFMKTTVFIKKGKLLRQLSIYYSTLLIHVFLSWFLFNHLFFGQDAGFVLSYFLCVIFMFFINFIIQKYIIFK